MHDIRAIRADATAFDAALARRGMSPVSPEILALDTRRRELETQIQRERAQANTVSKMIGAALREGRKDEADRLRSELGRNWDETLKAELVDLDLKLKSLLESLPNVLDADVPDG
ncbi:MAG: serine--tRNA ligase, partial [Rhodospirillales bacterium]|nr:serine--tRNA ligase [Rhodospirillales bacterium]